LTVSGMNILTNDTYPTINVETLLYVLTMLSNYCS